MNAVVSSAALYAALACCAVAQEARPAGAGSATRPAVQRVASAPARPETAAAGRTLICPVTQRPADAHCVSRYRGRWVYFADAAARRSSPPTRSNTRKA